MTTEVIRMTKAEKKRKQIQEILENSIYLEESGLYQRLEKNLLKLSGNDIYTLHAIVGIKISDGKPMGE